MHRIPVHPLARASALLLAALALATPARAQLDPSDPFIKDAKAGYNARTYYMNRDNTNGTTNEAWAFGGAVFGRTGYWRDTVQFGGTYYFSLPVYAPKDKDGTTLLRPGQESISVLGEAYARLKFGSNTLTLGRQEIDMNYKRAAGVRANRGDATYTGRQDNRMVPLTYEAVLLGGKVDDTVNYYAGWVNKAKPRNLNEFSHAGAVAGAKGSDSAMWMGGVQVAPMKDFWVQGWYHQVPDVIRIGYVDTDYVLHLAEKQYLRLGAQYTDQRSDGANLLTGKPFSTRNAQAYGEYGLDMLTFYGAYTRTGSGAAMQFPFSTGPIYTVQIDRSFVRAHESGWQLGIGADLAAWAPGVTAFADFTTGKDAINASSGAALPDEQETNIGVTWTLRQKGSFFDGLRSRARYSWVTDKAPAGDLKGTDLRIDLNLPINFL